MNFSNNSDTIGQVMTIERQPSRLLEKEKKITLSTVKMVQENAFYFVSNLVCLKMTEIPSQQF